MNTNDRDDIAFLQTLNSLYPDKVRLVPQPDGVVQGNASINAFFRECVDEDTVYVRLDDDIVWIEEEFFEKFLKFRIDNPQYFLVYPMIVNNAICTYFLKAYGFINTPFHLRANAMDKNSWENSKFAYNLHNLFIARIMNNTYEDWKIGVIPIGSNRFSINCISWFGKEFRSFDGEIKGDEEEYLTVLKPAMLGKTNCIYGNTIVVHYSFFTQRDYLDSTDLLIKYEKILNSTNDGELLDIYRNVMEYPFEHSVKRSNWARIFKFKIKVYAYRGYSYLRMKYKSHFGIIITDGVSRQ